jgi:hypothetical protein
MKSPKRAAGCDRCFPSKITGEDGTPSQRITWLCRDRAGFRLSDWKCVGLEHADCPKHNAELSEDSEKRIVATKESRR